MRYSWNVYLWKIKYNWSYLIIYSNNMKAYLNLVDKKLIQKQVWDILELEQLIDWRTKIEVNSKLIQEELEYLLNTKNIVQLQKKLISSRNSINNFNNMSLKLLLKWIKEKYKNINYMLEEYRNFLKIVFISKLDKEIAFKWLDENEFHHKLDTNMIIIMLLEDWKRMNNITSWKRDEFYSRNLVRLRNITHELDN